MPQFIDMQARNFQAWLELLYITPDLSSAQEIQDGIDLCNEVVNLSGAARDTLEQLYLSNPVEDGDLCSKRGREELVMLGMAARIVVKGQEGYTACTQKGFWVRKLMHTPLPQSQH